MPSPDRCALALIHRAKCALVASLSLSSVALLALTIIAVAPQTVRAQAAQDAAAPTFPGVVYLPNPSPLWTDSPVQILQMKFDHSGPNPDDTADGLDIQHWIGGKSYCDLNHKGMGKGLGEFDTEGNHNEPALWVAGTEAVDIKVRFKVNLALMPGGVPYLSKAKIKATLTSGTWLDVAETLVKFDHTTQYSEEGSSEYVTMRLGGSGAKIPAGLNWHNVAWSWSMKDQEFIDGSKQAPTVQLGTTNHQFITVLGKPLAPWYSKNTQHPTTSMLRSVIDGVGGGNNRGMGLAGTTSKVDFMEKVTDKLFPYADRLFSYNHTCLPMFVDHLAIDKIQRLDVEGYMFSDRKKVNKWMQPDYKFDQIEGQWIHVSEQAMMLKVIAALVGVDATLMRAGPFGYLASQKVMGDAASNANHIFWRESYKSGMQQKMVQISDYTNQKNTLARYFRPFKDLNWVEYDSKAFDCLVGPHKGTANRADYFTAMRNTDALLPTGVVNPLQKLENGQPVDIAVNDETSIPIIHTAFVQSSAATPVSLTTLILGAHEFTARIR